MRRSTDTAEDSSLPAQHARFRSGLARLAPRLRDLSILILLGLGLGLTLAWVVFLCWIAYGLLCITIG